jgi:hypothetical protein
MRAGVTPVGQSAYGSLAGALSIIMKYWQEMGLTVSNQGRARSSAARTRATTSSQSPRSR